MYVFSQRFLNTLESYASNSYLIDHTNDITTKIIRKQFTKKKSRYSYRIINHKKRTDTYSIIFLNTDLTRIQRL